MDVPRLAVGAIVFHDDRLLMIQRDKEPSRGLWSLPGGGVEHGEYLAHALAREVKEETALDIEVGELAGLLEVVGDEHHYVILDFVAELRGDPEPVAGSDVSAARWFSPKEVLELPCTPRFVETMRAWGVLPSADE